MKAATALLENLLKQQELLLGSKKVLAESEALLQELRAAVPPQIQGHFDRLLDRGKRGIAVVRHGVCCECHMRAATGILATLSRGEDIQLCGTCGRYLYLPEGESIEAPPLVALAKPAAKKRKRKGVTEDQPPAAS